MRRVILNRMRQCIILLTLSVGILSVGCSNIQSAPNGYGAAGSLCASPSEFINYYQSDLCEMINVKLAMNGFRLDSNVNLKIQGAINRAALEIRALPAVEQHVRFNEAGNNLSSFIDTLISEAKIDQDYEQYSDSPRDNRIDEETFNLAFDKLCPVWPICQ